jgi:hypothetical protein
MPHARVAIIENNVPFFRKLPASDRQELLQHVTIFLAEKHFVGAGGFTVTDEVRLMIAAQACLLLLHRTTDYYPALSSIVVYPGEYRAPRRDWDDMWVVTEWTEIRAGESFEGGTVVLSWEDVVLGLSGQWPGYNVVFHEFAHQLDEESWPPDGTPPMPYTERKRFVEVMQRNYEQLREEDESEMETFLDPYGAENPAEFFAVATESFFTQPGDLLSVHPELYEVLKCFYRQDPALWEMHE